MPKRPVLLFYCQHSLGLGDLVRALRIVEGLAVRFDVVLLNGARLPAGTVVPAGVTVVNLPPLGHDAVNRVVSHDPRFTVAQACEQRRVQLLETLAATSPRVLVVDTYPFGREKFEFELLPLLDAVAALGAERPLVVCSVRDILVSGRSDQADCADRVTRRVNRHFDAVLVHADPAFVRLEDSFRPTTPLGVPVFYTGFVGPAPCAGAPPSRPDAPPRVLVSVGGGLVGEPLIRAAVAAHRRVAEVTGLHTTVVGGPFLPEPVWWWLQQEAAASPTLTAVRRVRDLAAEMSRSTVTVSQAGYGTTMDILRSGRPAVVVPSSEGTEAEQATRAERLAALGAIRTVPAEALSARRLVKEIRAAVAEQPAPAQLDLSGVRRTVRRIVAMADLPPPAAGYRIAAGATGGARLSARPAARGSGQRAGAA